MELEFTKMHGVGNDFMVVRWPDGVGLPDAEAVRRWADRRSGVGFDQLLVLQAPEDPEFAAAYRVFNADGSEVEQCGNGVRCVARYLARNDPGAVLRLSSAAGPIEARVLADGEVSVNLGEPVFSPGALPFQVEEEADRYQLDVGGGVAEFGAVSLGNPHAVIRVDSVDTAPVGILGLELQNHPSFPDRVNVGFMEILDASRIRLRVLERGVGETQACGTGAAAAVAVGRRWGLLEDAVQVNVTGGVLRVQWAGAGNPLWLSGPTTWVYEGRIAL